VAEAGSVKGDDAIFLRKLIQEAADHEILSHGPVSVDQNHGTALPSRDIVDPHAVHLDKAAGRPWSAGLLGLKGLHHLPGLPDGLAGLLDSLVPVSDSGPGHLRAGFQGAGDLLGHEAGSAAGRLPDQVRKQDCSSGFGSDAQGSAHGVR